jgi:hypothetical protein
LRLQAKLTIGDAGDWYEQEADRMVEAVALAALKTVEELGLEPLSWELLRSPAPPEWPRQFWMPEQPEIRNCGQLLWT